MVATRVSKRKSFAAPSESGDNIEVISVKKKPTNSELGKAVKKGIPKPNSKNKRKKSENQANSVKAEENEKEMESNEGSEERVQDTKTMQISKKRKSSNLTPVFEASENVNEIENGSNTSEDEESDNDEPTVNQNSNSAKKGKMNNSKNQKKDRNSLIIGNLPFSATNNMLQELLWTVLPQKEIIKFNLAAYKDGKTKGFAYVEVSDKEAVQKVLKLNGSKMENRTLLVSIIDKKIENISTLIKNTLYISKINKSATDGQIIQFLEKVIPTNEIVRFERAKTFRGEPMGYLILEVASEEASEQIKKLNGVVLEGQAISIQDYRTSVLDPNFISTKHQKPGKGSPQFKKNFNNDKHSKGKESRGFKKRLLSQPSNENNKQIKSKKMKT